MRQPTNAQWWLLIVFSVLIVLVWPPRDDKSLAAKLVNWAVDPTNELPMLPDQLPLGQGDDPDKVNAHDLLVQQYDALYLRGGWTRMRLELKVAGDPFDPGTERQVLTAAAVAIGFLVWRGRSRTDDVNTQNPQRPRSSRSWFCGLCELAIDVVPLSVPGRTRGALDRDFSTVQVEQSPL